MSSTVSAAPLSTRRRISIGVGWRTSWSRMNSSWSWIALEIATHLIGLPQAETFFWSLGDTGFCQKGLLKS
jgi:hypothetical protein